jgi:hypothetical protein
MSGAGGGEGNDGDLFCSDFLVLRPENAGFYHLFHLLSSSKVAENGAVDCPAGTEIADLRRPWVVFVSLVVQVLLLWAKKPVALLGRATRYWMNLIAENGSGVLTLIVKALQGTYYCASAPCVIDRVSQV